VRIFKSAYTLPRPDGATILTRRDGKYARWKDRHGEQKEAALTKDGNRIRVETNRWSIAFEDHLRIKRTLTGYRDRDATQRLADFVQRLVYCRRNQAPLGDDLQDFIGGLDDETRQLFESWGLLDATQNELTRPLTELVGLYKTALEARERNPGHIKDIVQMATQSFTACGFTYWRDIKDQTLEAYLRALREGPKHLSYQRSNARLQACKSLCSWVADNRRWARESPLRGLKKLNAKEDPRHIRRGLSETDLRKLTDATANGPERYGMTGYERHLLYRLAIETALRRGEIRRLRKNDFDFDAGLVVVKAEKHTKNKKRRVQALRPELCRDLKAFLANKLPDTKAFGGTFTALTDRTARMIRQDLEAAGLRYEDDEGKCFDFHSLRGETASLMAQAGVPMNDAKDVMRHSDIHLTADVYAKTLEADQKAKAIACLPDLSLPERQQAVATGTDGREILSNSYSHSGQKRTVADASGNGPANRVAGPAISDNGDRLARSSEPMVGGSSPSGRSQKPRFRWRQWGLSGACRCIWM
jgi:integrase